MDVFNAARERAAGGPQVADLAAMRGRRAVFIGRQTRHPEALARLAPLDGLAITGVKPAQAAEAVRAADPAALWLVDLRLEDLGLLAGLTRLEALCLEDLPRLTDLAPLAGLRGLRLLSIKGLKRVEDLAPLASLAGLTALEIAPGSVVAKGITLDLGPLRALRGLAVLHIPGIRTPDLSTAVLDGFPKLTDLDIGGNWPVAELARLAARYPQLESRWLKPLTANAHYGGGGISTTLYDIDPDDHPEARITLTASGLRKPHELDPERDAARIARLRAEWASHLACFRRHYGME
ncbi:hypothetical protein LNKW23_25750 [Paralimibaculum aggregatum]|uniref:Leucine-rich repeat domain-containing protein n=2 Tax=Paralimibaculum aggregatum TaxID=3036245 RepID=A0ABQ6LNT2_9RHOB|nr:hypothetical protein LNKW23_25750 [Limibaculum sp. NKW23]